MNVFSCAYFGSVLLAVLLTPGVIRLARRIGAVDRPGPRGVHERPVPRIGGVAIFLAAVGSVATILILDRAMSEASRTMHRQLLALLGSVTFIFLVGLVDDLRDIPARLKLLVEILLAALLCLAGVRISSIALTDLYVLPLGGWGCVLTVLWIVGITNAVNLSDGLDGLAAGVCAITCGVIAIFALRSGQILLAVFMLALLGSLCGFLIFNFHPARIFMGDSGSLFVGFCLGTCSVMCVAKSAALVGLTLPALALGIPIFDTLFSALRRFLEDRSIFAPDRSHFHHHLLDRGLPQRQAVILIYGATLLAAGLGLLMLVRKDLGALAIFTGVLLLILVLFRAVGAIHVRQTLTRLHQKYAHARQAHAEQQTFERLQLGVRAVRTLPQRWQAVCEAAEQLELAWVSLHVTDARGNRKTTIWRRPGKSSVTVGSVGVRLHPADAVGAASTRAVWPLPPVPGPALAFTATETHGAIPHFARIMTMSFPLGDIAGQGAGKLEIAVLVNGSLQSANHRAGLFVRLAEEAVRIDN